MELNSKTNLLTAVTTIAWVASAHHAAVNFGQYAYSGWMPSHSPLCRKPAPAKGSKEWEVRLLCCLGGYVCVLQPDRLSVSSCCTWRAPARAAQILQCCTLRRGLRL